MQTSVERVVYAQAAQIRRTRERSSQCFEDGTAATMLAFAVLNEHSKAIRAWSRWWDKRKWKRYNYEYFEFLRDAILAQEFFLCERQQYLNFEECCRLLRTDRDHVWRRVWKEVDQSAWCWLVGLRALEMLQQAPVDEPESLTFPEFLPRECDDAPCVRSLVNWRRRAIPESLTL